MVGYYPTLTRFRDIAMQTSDIGTLRDPIEDQRLEDVEDKKSRGKGAPKKAKGPPDKDPKKKKKQVKKK